MSTTAAYDAFCALAGTFGQAQGLLVSSPGIGFRPPAQGLWLEVTWVPNATQNYGMSDDGPSLHRGLAQISVCGRPGAGIMPLTQVADAAIAAFRKGTTFGGMRVYRKPYQSAPIEQPERLMVPVTIMWQGSDS